jgi:hypothetical protein
MIENNDLVGDGKSPTTTPKPFCFVLMPLSEKFADVYQLGIKDACTSAGAYCERVDEQIFDERILDRIYNQIAKADLVVADMTGRNPNVFYEVGYAHALGKLTILLTQNAEDIPFDLKHFPHIVYSKGISTLREELTRRVKYFLANPPTSSAETKLALDIFLHGQNVATGDVVWNVPPGTYPNLNLTVFNASSETFDEGGFKLGIQTSNRFSYTSPEHVDSIKLPEGGYIHMLPDFPVLFPNGYASFNVILRSYSNKALRVGEDETATIRLLTKQGNWDFTITLHQE